jgi:protein-export membrane protein SecD
MYEGFKWKFLVIFLVILFSVWQLYPLSQALNLGLDLKGGIYLVYRIDESRLPQDLSETDAVNRALEIIRNRIDQFGVTEPDIQRTANNRIIVALPGVKDPGRAKEVIGKTALLEFRVVAEQQYREMANAGVLPSGYEEVPYREQDGTLVLEEDSELTGRFLDNANVQFARQGGVGVALDFNEQGADRFADLTRNNVGQRIAIVLDGKIVSAPSVNEPITGGQAQISGGFTDQEARDLALMLRAGALPAPLNLISERSIGPSLGEDSIRSGLIASVAALILVMIFMLGYYQFAGLVADVTLALALLFLMAGLASFGATLTLPGIAGIILTIGMAVDANVIIFERIKEELLDGKPVRTAINTGFDRAYTAIIDAQVTTVITAVALYWFGTGPVKGFAVTLTLGILATLFSAIFIGKFLFALCSLRREMDTLHIGWGKYE